MPEWLVVDAVCRELVSARFPEITGNLQGKSRFLGSIRLDSRKMLIVDVNDCPDLAYLCLF